MIGANCWRDDDDGFSGSRKWRLHVNDYMRGVICARMMGGNSLLIRAASYFWDRF